MIQVHFLVLLLKYLLTVQYVIGTGLGPPESPMNKTEAFFMEFTASKDDQHKYNYSQV